MASYAKTKTGGVNAHLLQAEIEVDSGIAPACTHVTEDSAGSDGFTADFDAGLSAGEETALDAVVTAHVKNAANYISHGALSVCAGVCQLPAGATFEDLGGVLVKVDFAIADLTKALGQANMVVEATGTGAELRIVERLGTDLSDEVVIAAAQAIADSSGARSVAVLNTDTLLRGGRNEYVLQGRLNGATSASISSAVLIVLENIGS